MPRGSALAVRSHSRGDSRFDGSTSGTVAHDLAGAGRCSAGVCTDRRLRSPTTSPASATRARPHDDHPARSPVRRAGVAHWEGGGRSSGLLPRAVAARDFQPPAKDVVERVEPSAVGMAVEVGGALSQHLVYPLVGQRFGWSPRAATQAGQPALIPRQPPLAAVTDCPGSTMCSGYLFNPPTTLIVTTASASANTTWSALVTRPAGMVRSWASSWARAVRFSAPVTSQRTPRVRSIRG